jgi:hypothetical protein
VYQVSGFGDKYFGKFSFENAIGVKQDVFQGPITSANIPMEEVLQ